MASSLASVAREDRSDALLAVFSTKVRLALADGPLLSKNQRRKENGIRRYSRSLLPSSRSRTSSRSPRRASASRSRCDSHLRKVKDTTQKKKDRGAQVSVRVHLGGCRKTRENKSADLPVSDMERRKKKGVGTPQVAHAHGAHLCWKRTWAVAAMRAFHAQTLQTACTSGHPYSSPKWNIIISQCLCVVPEDLALNLFRSSPYGSTS